MSRPGVTLDIVNSAVFHINEALKADSNYADLSDQLGVFRYSEPSTSGLQENDYPVLSDDRIGLAALKEVGSVKRLPLPAELAERFAYVQTNCLMGLFPSIRRAWLSIDSDIFIWNYEDGSDVAYYDGLSETILSVALVKPKPGIFQPHIVYLLCLATPVDIVLLGVSFLEPSDARLGASLQYNEMHLLPEPLFSVPTDGVHVMHIEATQHGRIFLAGKDGCLYELAYQADDGWFSRKCRKINHSQGTLSFLVPSFLDFSLTEHDPLVQISIDESRNVLYTRSEKGTIQLYDLRTDGLGMRRVAAVSLSTTVHNAAVISRTVERSIFEKLVYIGAVSKSESSNVHLVAVTSAGARLYFTVTKFGQLSSGLFTSGLSGMMSTSSKFYPSILALIHVRLPPGFTVGVQHRPTNVHSAFYQHGVTVLVAAHSDDSDMLWLISSDNFPFRSLVSESHDKLVLDGRSWTLAEVPQDESQYSGTVVRVGVNAAGVDRPSPPAVVTQHVQLDRQFVIINSKGTYLISKLSPMEQLHHLLVNYGADSAEVKAYFRLHREQASASSLALMCSRSLVHQQVIELSTRAFFLHGGEPECVSAAPPAVTGGPVASTPYQGVAPRQLSFSSPGSTIAGSFISPPDGQTNIVFSYKHRGLCLYLGRILRPIWDVKLTTEVMSSGCPASVYLTNTFTGDQLTPILLKLRSLKDFIDTNSVFTSSLAADSGLSAGRGFGPTTSALVTGHTSDLHAADDQLVRRYRAEVDAEESASLKQLQTLISVACEYLGLWKILCDHQFHVIAGALAPDAQNTLRLMTFQLLLTSGRDVVDVLIRRLIELYICDSAATDAISARLRDVCPSLYSCGDELYSKANEKLNAAKKAVNIMEQEKLIADALDNYKQVASEVDLPTVCAQLTSVRCYRGVVDVVLTAAAKRDPQNRALHFYHNGRPSSDTQGLHAFNIRRDCYRCITETLDYLLSTGQQFPQAPSVPRLPGPPPVHDPGRLSGAEAEKYAEDVYFTALKSDDEMFHMALYDWLMCKQMPEKLLSVQSPYLEPYLKQNVVTQPDNIAVLDLMWKYYDKQRNFTAAARILAKLAEKHSVELGLQQRMEYLSRAAVCAKSCTSRVLAPGDGEFLHDLEDKMEVARIQQQVLDALKQAPQSNPAVQDAIARLNCQLFDISMLYSEFADVFDLSESKLSIIHCADHHDPALVETLWKEIIDKQISSHVDSRTCIVALSSKIVSLGRVYAASENYFPLTFLVKYVEQCSVKLGFVDIDASFVFHAMMDVGITMPRLLDVYDQLFKSRDSVWQSTGDVYHLLFVVYDMLDEFANKPQLVPAYERRVFIVNSLDVLAAYLVLLQADTTGSVGVRQLMTAFKDVQPRLERLL